MGQLFVINLKCPPELDGEATVYVGRPSPLGNPFPLRNESDRPGVIQKYRAWLHQQVEQGNPSVLATLDDLRLSLQKGDVGLKCYCAPRACHADVIIEFLQAKASHT